MKSWLWTDAKYAFARISFHLDAHIYFTNRHKNNCLVSLDDINKKLAKVSGLAVKLGIIIIDKEEEFRQRMYEREEKAYSPTKK